MAKMKKKELGKGIGALLSSFGNDSTSEIPVPPLTATPEVVKELTNTIIDISVDAIHKNPFQPRKDFEPEALELLKNSIETHGLIQPITVRSMGDGTFQLISGERRLKASKLVGLTKIPAYIRIVNDNQEMLELALVENIHRADLNPMEVAFTYQRLMDECMLTQEQLSKRVGISRVTVTSILSLLRLPPDIQKSLKERKISRGHAIILSRVEDIAIQLSLLNRIETEDLSVRKLEQLIRSYKTPQSSSPTSANSLPEDFQQVQNDLQNHLERKVEIKRKKSGKGQIVIPFSSTKDFNEILAKIDSNYR